MIWVYAEGTHDLVGVLERYSSMRVVRRYSDHGEIEIHAPAEEAAPLLRPGTVLWLSGEGQAYIIDGIEITPDAAGDTLVATGYTASHLLKRRVVTESEVFTGFAGDVAGQLVDKILSQPGRGFPLFSFAPSALGDEIEYESDPTDLGAAVVSLCKAGGLGLRSTFDLSTHALTVALYAGADRTLGGAAPVVLSPRFDNLTEVSYVDSLNPYKNVVYVLGEDAKAKETDAAPRIVREVGAADASGYARFEAVATSGKSRSVSEDAGGPTAKRELSEEEYIAVLDQYGTEYLGQTVRASSVEGEIVPSSKLYRLGVDYDLGDIVTVRHEAYGVEHDMRVQEIEDVYEQGAHQVRAILGDPLPTLMDKIKLKDRQGIK